MILAYPICSMHGIFTNIYPINHPNVAKYTSTMERLGMIPIIFPHIFKGNISIRYGLKNGTVFRSRNFRIQVHSH